ncbi:MAG: hypothetical protein A2268_02245 [Candidatus Raymondbacteria bacterium RifOxyA12_full_50_37]|uniref:Type II secretion system protein GspF domain-containing protein n=1 Tax=Candidatus Raymondbacteria bacterium RIFOXYD12_FULL_49_13 TaxID=1817890 RepID=A0A1F7F5L4_UNCRA|nr:MAG: hypothetical protein A2350_07770 [Candidatus Raymondbacteria bacterium RifOxyB12_full_50_8]OGJ91275.1 MAG: hypothetical protein A2268_02245 [Candidatus Raymondbacteria bacterium RifOxyA12_full_50_37]OGJ92245.1 MAG: hypothetical protein A2248_11075 [Candidatus Raymondbacteria bacterium RIFOXYA2_FULL_49_16]OGJ98571.1 MAG: hypothetical protein A2453_06875 [Candidatus Raymondbacteria bacterium RIFOXYC2_FULL_50_21]OGK01872.1 MAG: hypothetical protein A2519_04770 [Candidatus Raymondbacteria b
MAKFTYRAKDLRGLVVQGIVEASSKEEVIQGLEKRKLTVESVKRDIQINPFKNMVSSIALSRFTRQLSAMVNSGLPLVEALEVLAKQRASRKMQTTVAAVVSDVRAGKPFYEALQRHEAVFGRLYVSLVKAGESAGALGEILERLAEHLEKNDAIRRKVRGALLYPAVIVLVAIAAVTILLLFVVPTFAKMFADLGRPLPFLTSVIIQACTIIQDWALLLVISGTGALVVLNRLRKTPWFRFFLDGFTLRIPYFGDLLKKSAISRFSRTLATLLRGGVPLVKALEICGGTAGNVRFEKAVGESVIGVAAGLSLNASLGKSLLFPEMTVHMIEVGERIGELPKMMERVSYFYDGEVTAAVEGVLSIIEPVMIVFLAAIIGVILIAMYMPLFDMMTVLD